MLAAAGAAAYDAGPVRRPARSRPAPLTSRLVPVRLADFLRTEHEVILTEWETFARSCAPWGESMDVAALRDHAALMLSAFADDLGARQTPAAQAAKALGRGAPAPGAGGTGANGGALGAAGRDAAGEVGGDAGGDAGGAVARAARHTAAGEHGAGRAASGFTVAQMTAEYRALRASVVRLWTATLDRALAARDVEDLTRFHEAVDQALAESLARFETEVGQAKETFLAILGHDLRTPLAAIQTSAAFLVDVGALPEAQRALAVRIGASADRSIAMVGELLDFTRSRLGGGIPVVTDAGDLLALVRDVVAEVQAAHPAHAIVLQVAGADGAPGDPAGAPLAARFDAARLSQALANLLGNAVQHGRPEGRITVTVTRPGAHGATQPPAHPAGGVATVAVHNEGVHIAPDQLDGLFNPLQSRGVRPLRAARGPTSSLGLGLYIAERIVHAHGGQLGVISAADAGTTFTVTLPADPAALRA